MKDHAPNSKSVVFHTFGYIDWISEIGDALTWLATALRAPATKHCKVIPCRSSVTIVRRTVVSSDGVTWEIQCSFNEILEGDFPPNAAGTCWHDMFFDSNIATGYLIPKKPKDIIGLELSLFAMTALIGASRLTNFGPHVFLKGYSSLLVLTKRHDKICQWHYVFNNDGSRIRYTDPRVKRARALEVEDVSTCDAWIGSMRHVIGWCQDVHWVIGKQPRFIKLTVVVSILRDGNPFFLRFLAWEPSKSDGLDLSLHNEF